MKHLDEGSNLHIELDTKECQLSASEIAKMETDLETLRKLVTAFPVCHLHIAVRYHPRNHDYHVKTSLVLTGKTLFTGDRDPLVHPAYNRCLRKLVRKVASYKQQMGGDAERAKHASGTHQTLQPTGEPDQVRLRAAIDNGDFVAFRKALYVFEEPVRKRIGRWIQRYPALEAQLGTAVEVADLVEEVFLNAFEQYARRPDEVPLGQWLDGLIDPSVKALWHTYDAETDNIEWARGLREAEEAGA